MLKRLRRKFVLINMAMVSVVVIVVLASICVINYQQSTNAVYAAISSSIEQAQSQRPHSDYSFDASSQYDGFLFNSPFSDFFASNIASSSSTSSTSGSSSSKESTSTNSSSSSSGSSSSSTDDSSALSTDSDTSLAQPQIGDSSDSHSVPTAIYRAYAINDYSLVMRVSSAALVSTSADDCIAAVYSNEDGQGILDDYGVVYVKETVEGIVYLGFASKSSIGNWWGFTLTLVLVGFATLLVFLLLSLIFSRWALKPVEESWAQQKQFLADASHELKTPLTVILANTDIMLKHPERSIASQEQWLESTQHEALGMQELVISMLDLARLDAEDGAGNAAASVPMEDVNLSDIALGSILQFEIVAFEKQVNLVDDVADNMHVTGNAHQLERLCGTLLDNAVKYAPADSTIEVNLKIVDASTLHNLPHTTYQGDLPKGKAVMLSVKNEGEPVDPEDLPHLFDRFYRSDKARTHESSGNSYGLGLAIAAGTVNAHHGCIMATSSADLKTTFAAILPLSQA